MFRKSLTIALVAATITATAATAFTTSLRYSVRPVSADGLTFEVIRRPGTSANHYWCAAGEYTRRKTSVPNSSAMVVERGEGPSLTGSSARSVVFRAGVEDTNSRSGVTDIQVGRTMSVTHANGLCQALQMNSRRR